MNAKTISTEDSYRDKLAKLIPAEAIALNITLTSTIASAGMTEESSAWYVLVCSVFVGVVGVPLVLRKVYGVTLLSQHLMSVFAFVIWVLNVSLDSLQYLPGSPQASEMRLIASLVLIAFTFMAPLIVSSKAAKGTS